MVDVDALVVLVDKARCVLSRQTADALRRGIVALGKERDSLLRRNERQVESLRRFNDANRRLHSETYDLGQDRDALRAENARLLSALAQAHIDLGSEVNGNDCECDDCIRFRAPHPRTRDDGARAMSTEHEAACREAMDVVGLKSDPMLLPPTVKQLIRALEKRDDELAELRSAIRTRCSHTCAGREGYAGKQRHEPNCLAFEMDLT